MRARRVGVVLDKVGGRLARRLHQVGVERQVGEAEQGIAALTFANELAGTAQLEVALRDLEAIGVLENDAQPLARISLQRLAEKQHADAVPRAAPDAAAQLME